MAGRRWRCAVVVAVGECVGRPSLFWPRTGVTRGTPKEATILVLGIRSGGSSAASVCPGLMMQPWWWLEHNGGDKIPKDLHPSLCLSMLASGGRNQEQQEEFPPQATELE
ncbi:bisphosphoglycerate mutase isoform X2 [Chroicocephalus ridibundus]|uniref:bisphosphoglycerate mutase isoform X2 n=1 Tax=Chroicocephalus ridibundus TaxID=1192867 RepID=UPI002FDE441C